jgi:hypothetical protein
MPIKLLTLRQSFDQIFHGKNSFDYDALCAMIDIEDSYNNDVYMYDASFRSSIIAKGNYETDSDGNFVLYSRSTDSDGKEVFTVVATPDEFVSSSVELYLRAYALGGGSEVANADFDPFVHIYTLRKLNVDLFNSRAEYGNTASRVAAILYAMCCAQNTLMRRHINDIEAVNREQKELNRISSLLAVIQNDLREKDTGVEDVADRHTSTVYADVVAFFILRGLLDTASDGTVLNGNTVNLLKCILLGNEVDVTVTTTSVDEQIDINIANENDFIDAFDCTRNSNLRALHDKLEKVYSTKINVSYNDLLSVFGDYYDITPSLIRDTKLELVAFDSNAEHILSPGYFEGNPIAGVDNLSDFLNFLPAAQWIGWRPVLEPLDESESEGESESDEDVATEQGNAEFVCIKAGAENLGRWQIFAAAHEGDLEETRAQMLDFIDGYVSSEDVDAGLGSGIDVKAVLQHILNDSSPILYKTVSVNTSNIAPGGHTISLMDSVRAWMQFQALVKHYDTFFGDDDDRFTPVGSETDFSDLNLDPFSSDYWVRASDSENNTFKGVIGFGDHWVFDPRIRRKDGELLTTGELQDARRYVYFDGFSAVNTGTHCENYATMWSGSTDKGSTAPTQSVYSPEYSVSWFGKNPPTSATDFEYGIAGGLSREYGGKRFISSDCFVDDLASGRKRFSEGFRSAIRNDAAEFVIRYCAGDTLRYFYVSQLGPLAEFSNELTGEESCGWTIRSCRLANPTADYWPTNFSSGGGYAILKDTIQGKTSGLKINAEHCGMWSDSLRIYTDQVSNDTTGRTTAMQITLQMAQQALSTATNLMKAIYRYFGENINNIRL